MTKTKKGSVLSKMKMRIRRRKRRATYLPKTRTKITDWGYSDTIAKLEKAIELIYRRR